MNIHTIPNLIKQMHDVAKEAKTFGAMDEQAEADGVLSACRKIADVYNVEIVEYCQRYQHVPKPDEIYVYEVKEDCKACKKALKKATLKTDLEKRIGDLLLKYNVSYCNEAIIADIYSFTWKGQNDSKVEIVFNDEYMGEFVSGNVSSRVYDEFEQILTDLGYEIIDCDYNLIELGEIK
jgi:hypothetical protein